MPLTQWLLLLGAVLSVSAAVEIANTLAGTSLRCCVVHEPPIAFLDNKEYVNGGISGVVAEYLREMQALLGWNCSVVTPYEYDGSTTVFNNFIDMMDNCTSNGTTRVDDQCECDIGIGGWLSTAARYDRVDLLPPFAQDGFRVIFDLSVSNTSINSLFFLTTFDRASWACIFVLIMLFSIGKLLDHRFAPFAPQRHAQASDSSVSRFVRAVQNKPLVYRFPRAFLSVFKAMITQSDSDQERRRSTPHRSILNLIVGVSGLFLVLAYEASMTASLVHEQILSEFRSVEDFKSCRIPPEVVCIPEGGAIDTYWTQSIAEGNECHKGRPPRRGSLEENYEAGINGLCRYGILLDSTARLAVNTVYCGRFLLSENLLTGGLSLVLPKGSNLTRAMSIATLRITEESSPPSVERYFRNVDRCEVETGSILQLKKLVLFFVLAFSFSGAYIVVMIAKNVLRGDRYARRHNASKVVEESLSREYTILKLGNLARSLSYLSDDRSALGDVSAQEKRREVHDWLL